MQGWRKREKGGKRGNRKEVAGGDGKRGR